MKYATYSHYGDSGVEWIGNIPVGWTTCRLGYLFKRRSEKDRADAELLSVYRDYGVIPKSSRDDNFNKPSEDLSAYQYVEIGDLVLNKMKTWQGSIAISAYEGIVSPAYFVATPTTDANLRYLHYLLRSDVYIAQYHRFSTGIRPNQWDLSFNAFQMIEALLPPKPVQSEIATFLDRETVQIDTLIAKQQYLIELLQEKRQALISHAVTKGLNPDAPMKDSGVEWLGETPQHWTAVRFPRCTQITNGQVDPRDEPYRSMILIAPNHIESGTGRITYLETSEEQAAISGKYYCRTGDVIYSKIRPALAKVCIAPKDCLCSADMYPIQAKNGLVNQYLFWYMLSMPFTLQATLESERVAMPKVNRETLAAFYIPVPPTEEQRLICEYLQAQCAKIDILIDKATAAIDVLGERRTALISAAVTGKIDVRSLVN